MEKTGTSIGDYDLIEANEAFAVAGARRRRGLGWDWDRVNVNGGAIALGHPIGASGARVLTTLLYALQDRDHDTRPRDALPRRRRCGGAQRGERTDNDHARVSARPDVRSRPSPRHRRLRRARVAAGVAGRGSASGHAGADDAAAARSWSLAGMLLGPSARRGEHAALSRGRRRGPAGVLADGSRRGSHGCSGRRAATCSRIPVAACVAGWLARRATELSASARAAIAGMVVILRRRARAARGASPVSVEPRVAAGRFARSLAARSA